MSLALVDVVQAVRAACHALGARWYVFGAQAAILRGAVRHTEDVDFTIDLAGRATRDLVDALATRGVALRVTDADDFIAATQVLPLVHRASGTPIDVVLAGSALEARFFDRAESITVDGVDIRVPCIEDLLVMKVLAARPKDLEDVAAIAAANPDHDAAAVRETRREIEAAIEHDDLLPAYDAALVRARRARR